MGKAELGNKQTCLSCAAKFYDLGKRPATCPKCGHAFDPDEAIKLRTRRTRPVDYDREDSTETTPVAPVEPDGFEDEVEVAAELGSEPDAPDILEDEDGNEITPEPATADIGVDFEDDVVLADDDEADDTDLFLADDEEDLGEGDIDGIGKPEDDDV